MFLRDNEFFDQQIIHLLVEKIDVSKMVLVSSKTDPKIQRYCMRKNKEKPKIFDKLSLSSHNQRTSNFYTLKTPY